MGLSLEQQLIFDYFKMVNVSYAEDTVSFCREVLTSLEKPDNSEEQIMTILSSINDVIRKYDMEIVERHDEITGRKMHTLISTINNPVAQKANFYDKSTCELLGKIIEECVLSESGSVSEIVCLNWSKNLQANKSKMQSSLEKLIKDKWIVSENGKVILGMRCLLEFEHVIKKQYPTYVKSCVLCKTFLMQGISCQKCKNHAHFHCRKRICEANNIPPSSSDCPFCKGKNDERGKSSDCFSDAETVIADDLPVKRRRKTRKIDS